MIFVRSAVAQPIIKSYQKSQRSYECSNHLGNVIETVSDKPAFISTGLVASTNSYSDYYPYGIQMIGRNESTPRYRYGFNGMEKDDELKGEGNSLDFGARIYDPRIGRWLTMDPLSTQYPDLSSYNFVANSVLLFVDPSGRTIEVWWVDAEGTTQVTRIKSAADITTSLTQSTNSYETAALQALDHLNSKGDQATQTRIKQAMEHDQTVKVGMSTKKDKPTYSPTNQTIPWDPTLGMEMPNEDPSTKNKVMSSEGVLNHELAHFLKHAELKKAVEEETDPAKKKLAQQKLKEFESAKQGSDYYNAEEERVNKLESSYNKSQNYGTRDDGASGEIISVEGPMKTEVIDKSEAKQKQKKLRSAEGTRHRGSKEFDVNDYD